MNDLAITKPYPLNKEQEMKPGENHNHPKTGARIKVGPIRSLDAIQQIKGRLASRPRDLCLFMLGINTAFRASDLLSLTVGQVQHLKEGDDLEVKEQKTRKHRRVTLNKGSVEAIRTLLRSTKKAATEPLFLGQRGVLSVPSVNRLVKRWCRWLGLSGNFGAHTLRKTWGYHQRVTFNTPLPILMRAYGHSSQHQTLQYLCIQPDEVRRIYQNEL